MPPPTRKGDVDDSPLSWVESQRALAVVEDAVDRIEVLSSIAPDVMRHREDFAKILSDEIASIIDQQHELENQYGELVNQRNVLKTLPNKTKYKENQKEIDYVAERLRETTKMLCKSLKENPRIADNLHKMQVERQSLQAMLMKVQKELAGTSTYTQLRIILDDQQKRHANLAQLVKQERESAVILKKLEKELIEEKDRRDSEIVVLDDTISHLKEELAQVKAKSALDINYGRKMMEAKTNAAQRSKERVENTLKFDIERQTERSQVEDTVSGEVQAYLEKSLASLKSKVLIYGDDDYVQKDEWLNRYEKDIEAMDTNISSLKSQRASTLSQIQELLDRCSQCDAFLESEDRYKREMERQAEVDARLCAAAIRVQAVWRGHAIRKKLAAKKKKLKKKKKTAK